MLIKSTILKIRNKSKEKVMNEVAFAMKGHTRFIIKSFSVKTEVYMRTREERKKKNESSNFPRCYRSVCSLEYFSSSNRCLQESSRLVVRHFADCLLQLHM